MSNQLTPEEMEQILKAIVGYNKKHPLQFDVNYLKYAGEIEIEVERTGDTIKIKYKGIKK